MPGRPVDMVLLLGLAFPLLLLGLALVMQRVEQGLTADPTADLETFLATARPDEIEAYVSQGLGPALDRYWRRRRRRARRLTRRPDPA